MGIQGDIADGIVCAPEPTLLASTSEPEEAESLTVSNEGERVNH